MSKTDAAKATDYEARASRWLADGNEADERGNRKLAQKCWDKAQFWLDRANVARGWN